MSAPAFNPAKYLPSAAYKKAGILVQSVHLAGTASQTSGNYDAFFIAPYACVVLSVDAAWSVASSSGTLDVLKASNATAISGGTSVLSSTISTAATANTVVSGTLSTTAATVQLTTGQRLGINSGGSLASGQNLVVTVVLCPIPATS